MRFMLIHKADANTESSGPPPAALMHALGVLIGELTVDGKVLSSEGLIPSEMGSRVRVGGGDTLIADGPFVESKDVIGGYAIIKTDSKEEAVEIGRRWMQIHADVLGPDYHGEGEIRQLMDFEH